MEKKKWKKKEKGTGRKRNNDNYYLLRMILNKRFCFCIQFFKSIYSISINIVSKENVYHIFQNMGKHGQYLKIVS